MSTVNFKKIRTILFLPLIFRAQTSTLVVEESLKKIYHELVQAHHTILALYLLN